MNKESDLRFTIIGLGNLMEAIFPCIADIVGQEKLFRQVNATTADETDLKRKEMSLGIKVILDDNLKALKEMEPDIILFAPPPSVAQRIIQNEFKEYFEYIRSKSLSLADIYSFPPVPPGSFYNDILGDDVLVVNIIPNTVRTIMGKPLIREGVSICTFSTDWPRERIDRLEKIISPLGIVVDLRPQELLPLLGAGVMVHVLPEVVISITDKLEEKRDKAEHQQLAKYMRARFQQETGFQPEENGFCIPDLVETHLQPALDAVILGWYEGLLQYCLEMKFSQERTVRILNPMIDHQLHVLHGERRDVIERNAKIEATKGGVLEKGTQVFHESIEPLIAKGLEELPITRRDELQQSLLSRVKETAYIVQEHAKTLANLREE